MEPAVSVGFGPKGETKIERVNGGGKKSRPRRCSDPEAFHAANSISNVYHTLEAEPTGARLFTKFPRYLNDPAFQPSLRLVGGRAYYIPMEYVAGPGVLHRRL